MVVKPRLLCVMQLPPPVHGVTAVNERVAHSEIIASRFELEILPLQFADTLDDLGRLSATKLARALSTAARLTRRLVADPPSAVYFTLTPRGAALYRDCVYVAIIKAFGVPRIFHMHSQGIANQLDRRWKRVLLTWLFRDAWVIHLSPTLERDTIGIVDESHVLSVANGIADRHERRVRPVTNRVPRVLYLSNMIVEKGALILLEAIAALKERGASFEATFAGARFNDGCIERFDELVARHGLASHVRYVGPVYGEAKEALYQAHDVFVLPTTQDAFPLVLLEAMQHALPVISTREGAIPEIVDDGRTGFLVPKQDVDALANRIETLLLDVSLRVEMARNARARFLDRFTAHQFENNLADALERCVDQRSPR